MFIVAGSLLFSESSRYRCVAVGQLSETPEVAVVVDVMRAFTVAAWAFARGAERIVLACTEAEALGLKRDHPGWLALKDGPPVEGFDAVNSPGLVRAADLRGRTVVQKTTAGTVGALAVADAPLVLCASFVVADATARLLRGHADGPVTFVITGENGTAEEDRACAEYIAARMEDEDANAAPHLARARASRAATELTDGLRRGYQGIHPDDVELCLEADRFPFALVLQRAGTLTYLTPRH